ncbi:MAG: response regulator [Armatimonadota bacterium]
MKGYTLTVAKLQPSILVVDDEPNVVRLIQMHLKRHGYQVETAHSGRQALAKIKANRPDLLITDWTMPEMDGLELLGLVRQDPALAGIPVILLTARPNDVGSGERLREHVEWCKHRTPEIEALHIDDVLLKPFNPKDLILVVESFLQRPI